MGSMIFCILLLIGVIVLLKKKPLRFKTKPDGYGDQSEPRVIDANKPVAAGLAVIFLLTFIFGMFIIADSDQQYVIQWPNGTLNTHFEPGLKVKFFGKVYSYDRVVAVATPAFVKDKVDDGQDESGDDDGSTEAILDDGETNTLSGTIFPPIIRFNDAAKGSMYGILRMKLPQERNAFLQIHREFGSDEALVNNVLKGVFRSSSIASARLMSIQEYITKRGADFEDYFADQISNGLFKTQVTETVIERVAPGQAIGDKVEGSTLVMGGKTRVDEKGRTIIERVEIVRDASGVPVRQGLNDIARYNLDLITARVTYVHPEKKVRTLIGKQRDSEARASLAENDRRAALLEAEAASAEGQKAVAKARADETAIQTQATIAAETEKQKALIAEQQALETAELRKQAAQLNLDASLIDAQRIEALADANSYERKKMMDADNALEPKLAAEIEIQTVWANAYATRSVPQMMFTGSGDGSGGTGSNADVTMFQQMLNALIAKELAYDRSVGMESNGN